MLLKLKHFGIMELDPKVSLAKLYALDILSISEWGDSQQNIKVSRDSTSLVYTYRPKKLLKPLY